MRTLYLCGGGNPEGVRLAVTVNRVKQRWDRIVLLDDDPRKHGQSILGVEVAGPFSLLERADRESSELSNMVARTTVKRASAFRKLERFQMPFATLIDPNVDTTGVEFEPGITIYQHVSFCAGGRVGAGAVVFTGAVVGHGCQIGRGSVVAPGAVINARVDVGEGVYIGTNASILPDLTIGRRATIGANSAIVQNVPSGATMMGVPAQVLLTEPLAVDTTEETERPARVSQNGAVRPQTHGRTDRPLSPALERLRFAQRQFLDTRRVVTP